jgi:lipopolysaccharide biosynthesis glycosyltransferase
MFSALRNLRQGLIPVLYIIDGGISEYNKQKIERVFKKSKREFTLNWIPYNLDSIQSVRATNILSKAAYLRILIPDLLPEFHQKAIYLDCDIIVETDLYTLWEYEFSNEPAMGVQDFYNPYISTVTAIPNLDKLSMSEDAAYCNSGVIVFNLEFWRKHKLKDLIFEYLQKNFTSKELFDQDGINVIVSGRWKTLDPRWNITLSSLSTFGRFLKLKEEEVNWYLDEFKKNPFIIHFTSKHKPWHTGHKNKEALTVFYYDQFYRERYFYYLGESGWFNKAYSRFWINHRKMILFLEYKLPRKIKTHFSKN